MTLNGFLLTILILLPLMLVLFYKGNKISKNPISYFFIIALATALSYLTFTHYSKSHGGYYKNTEYHLIQQEGFKYPRGQKLLLASDKTPERAILETGIGELYLDGEACLHSRDFQLPLFVETEANSGIFHVMNIDDNLSMGDGDELSVMKGNDLLFRIKYEEIKNEDKINSYHFVFSVRDATAFLWKRREFRQGYALADILQTGLDAYTRGLIENCYLVRGSYKMDDVDPVKVSGKVYLVGVGQLVNEGCSFYKNDQLITPRPENDVRDEKMSGRLFFYGLRTARSQVYKVSTDVKSIFVLYRLPVRYHFPEIDNKKIHVGESKLFLTTDKQEIIRFRDKYDCFYLFSDQVDDNTIYKASAAIDYIADSAGVLLAPKYVDLNEDVEHAAADSITMGKTFEIKTLSCRLPDDGTAHVSYLFSIQNMRRNEVYRNASTLYIVVLLMLLVIYLLLYLLNTDENDRINKAFILETSVYLSLIAFLTVRLVMLWRLHAFPPIENVSRMEWDKLVGPENYTWTFIFITAVLGLRILVLLTQWIAERKQIRFRFKDAVDRLFYKIETIGIKWIVALFLPFVVYFLCALIGKLSTSFMVAIKETIAPLLAFAINSVYYVYRIRPYEDAYSIDQDEYKRRGVFSWFAILWNTLVFLLFLWLPTKLFGFFEHGMAFPMGGVFLLWFFIAIIITPTSRKLFRWGGSILAALLLLVVFWHVPLAQTATGKRFVSNLPDPRVKDRIVAVSETPSEMMQNQSVEFQEKSMQDILNASSNKWFIDNYLSQRYYLAKNGGGFILDKEYNQSAVNYTTQTRDVVLLRYLIYEHGHGVVKKLLWILLFLAITVFVVYKRKGEEMPFLQQLPLQSALFLFVYSAFLYLVNLNAVVFVGLDFPFLTLTSKVAPLGLLLPLFAILLPVNINRLDENFVGDLSVSDFDWQKALFGVLTAVLVLVCVRRPLHRMEVQLASNGGKASESFSVSMEPLAVFVNDYINPKLKDFQEDHDKGTSRRNKFVSMSFGDKRVKDGIKDFVMGKEGTSGLIDSQLKLFAKKTPWANDTTFIRSAFQKSFDNTSMTDHQKNIIHFKKLNNGYFSLVPNKVYYDMKPLFDNDSINDWQGDLLPAAGMTRMAFVGENHKEAISLKNGYYEYGSGKDVKNSTTLKEYFLGENREKNINFTIVQIPKEYCYQPVVNGQNVYVLKPVDAVEGKNYIVYPSEDPTNPIQANNVALWLKPNDIVKVSGAKQSFSFGAESGKYFSQRIHYNGKYQPIYPLGERFIFAYNFDQMLAEDYHPKDSCDQPVRISLDYDLLNDVYDYCESTMALNKSKEFGLGLTVAAVDGNGRIRLLADYNPKKRKSVDPNNAKEIQELMDNINLNGNKPEDRSLLQNRNLLRMAAGPGSTIKVPFYVAAAAKSHIDWTKLKVSFPSGAFDGNVVKKFGYYPTKGIHHVDGWDEMAGEYKSGQTMEASRFITSSNNYFFGSMIALATYSPDKLLHGIDGALVSARSDEAVFPKYTMDGKNYYKLKDHFIGEFESDRALETSLHFNFRFLRWGSRDYTNQTYDIGPTEYLFAGDTIHTQKTRTRMANSLYVHSERPCLHREINAQDSIQVIEQFLHLTSGGAKYLEVTPLNMAEMYLRVALLNSAENILTFDDNADSIPYQPFDAENDNFAEQMKNTTFFGMWHVIEDKNDNGRVSNGTRGEGTLRNDTDKGVQTSYSKLKNPIYVYGKTGSIGESGANVPDNRNYAFILSNKRLDKETDRTGLKVYVVYFGYVQPSLKHSGTAKTRKAILDIIINSETFQNYWNE